MMSLKASLLRGKRFRNKSNDVVKLRSNSNPQSVKLSSALSTNKNHPTRLSLTPLKTLSNTPHSTPPHPQKLPDAPTAHPP
ncbi:hypothetical protein BC829DRAFT_407859, partial [Chytridium lagenaria]